MEEDAEIKEEAQKAYDAKVEEVIASIKAEVEVEYKVAKEYLGQLVEEEVPVEEPTVIEEAHQNTIEEMPQTLEQAAQTQPVAQPIDDNPVEVQ